MEWSPSTPKGAPQWHHHHITVPTNSCLSLSSGIDRMLEFEAKEMGSTALSKKRRSPKKVFVRKKHGVKTRPSASLRTVRRTTQRELGYRTWSTLGSSITPRFLCSYLGPLPH